MKYYLAKTDPKEYSIHDFATDKQITWSGIHNAQALRVLKAMLPGDKVLIYHTQGETALVGLAEVIGNSKPDPDDEKSWLVEFTFIRKFPEPYITLQAIKATDKFQYFQLVKQARLSTMEVPASFIIWLKGQGVLID